MISLTPCSVLLHVDARRQLLPKDQELLPKKQRHLIKEWCNSVPVLGFTSGKYDLNPIKNYFVEQLASSCEKLTEVGKKANQRMFLITPEYKFLDVMNYLGPGTSYEKRVSAYGYAQTKSWLPYKWSRQAPLPRPTSLSGVVLQANGWLPAHIPGMAQLPECLRRARDGDLCGLATVLQ